MLFNLLTYLSGIFFMLLHITGPGVFPKALSKEEEKNCLIKIKSGDKKARSKLIEHNLRLVAHVIKKYYRHLIILTGVWEIKLQLTRQH